MTGQHNGRNHILASTLDRSQRTFGHVAKDAGYATCVVGKWKLSGKDKDSRPSGFGFTEYCVTEGTGNDTPRYKNPHILQNGKITKYTKGEYGPDIVRDYALDFIEHHKDKPFFLYYPMVHVHTPLSPVPGTPKLRRGRPAHRQRRELQGHGQPDGRGCRPACSQAGEAEAPRPNDRDLHRR